MRISHNFLWGTLPYPVVGSLAGIGVGILSSISWSPLGRSTTLVFSVLAGIGGAAIGQALQLPGGRARTVAWWCASMGAAIGSAGFLLGFVGPLLLTPDSPQGPMLGIFVTGPCVVAGAVCGLIVGAIATGPKAA